LIILAVLKPLEERYRNSRQGVEIHLQADRGAVSIGALQQALGWRSPRVKQLVVRSSEAADLDDVTVVVDKGSPKDIADMIEILAKLPSVSNVREGGQ
jgi:putative Mg2+ transporter-C (MgtC) family protein